MASWPPVGRADRPGRARVVRAGVEGVVRALAERARRWGGSAAGRARRSPSRRRRAGAWRRCGRCRSSRCRPARCFAPSRAREELVPGADAGAGALDADHALRRSASSRLATGRARRLVRRRVGRRAASAGVRRSSRSSRAASAAAVEQACGRRRAAPVRRGRGRAARAPMVNISSTSTPAGILISALCSQVAQSSAKARTRQRPVALARRAAPRASPAVGARRARSVIRCAIVAPVGSVSTSSTPMRSWPSRKTVAPNGTTSPTKAFAGQQVVGLICGREVDEPGCGLLTLVRDRSSRLRP